MRIHPSFARTDHRPWPLPDRPWVWRQSWSHLLFAHWPVEAGRLRPFVPEALSIQEFDGTSWVGLVPFRLTGLAVRGMPAVPWVSAFAEMNLRLYVSAEDKPGVWFISLDASRLAAVAGARMLAHLPYFWASMSAVEEGGRVRYASRRRFSKREVTFRGIYWPEAPPYEASPGSLEHFLAERYCLYSLMPDGRIGRMQIHHKPWPLQRAAADFQINNVAQPQGIPLAADRPLLHFSRRIDVVGWGMELVT